VVLGHLRKHKNWLQRIFSIEEQGALLVEETVSLTDDSTLDLLDRHIARLPERARLVFILFAVEGYRHEEIASMLKMAVGSSKSQYHRARTLLKEWLEVDMYEECSVKITANKLMVNELNVKAKVQGE